MAFQSPSLRGSGRFQLQKKLTKAEADVSIPFIAGQWSLRFSSASATSFRRTSQSPSLRGSGRFRARRMRVRRHGRVSIPFIAGQWSLRSSWPPTGTGARKSQSPSLRGSGRFALRDLRDALAAWCLNPLHCGAVVASQRDPDDFHAVLLVSIPFIAGQWSLRAGLLISSTHDAGFNPLHCGAVVASDTSLRLTRTSTEVSIPFIAGQWSLLVGVYQLMWFQSPSLRGSGRFRRRGRLRRSVPDRFQSPSLRGSGRFPHPAARRGARRTSFNPLHCGAVVASRLGQDLAEARGEFQSPSLRGSGRFTSGRR